MFAKREADLLSKIGDPRADLIMAQWHMLTGNGDGAMACSERALKNLSDPSAAIIRANATIMKGDVQAARQAIGEACNRMVRSGKNGQVDEVYAARAGIAMLEGDSMAALNLLKQAEDSAPLHRKRRWKEESEQIRKGSEYS